MSFIAIFMSLDCLLTLHLSGACKSHFFVISLDQISRIEGDLVIWSYYRLPLRNLSIFLHQAFFLEIYICAVVQQI